jgi:7-cyano-7-deazaguanine synthase
VCAIFGFTDLGEGGDHALADRMFSAIRLKAKHRGRDDYNEMEVRFKNMRVRMGWCRATPTTEPVANSTQPFHCGEYSVFHNGTIANDRELGNPEGRVDSAIIPEVLERHGLSGLSKLKGSFALAIASREYGLVLACNYKPIYYVERDGFLFYASLEWMLDPVIRDNYVAAVKLNPYTMFLPHQSEARSLRPGGIPSPDKVLVVCSGGLDSTVAATKYVRDGHEVTLLHFDYGCKAGSREASVVEALAERLGCKLIHAALPSVSVAGSSITSGDAEIAESIAGAEYAHEWVPARNFQMLAIACGIAEANNLSVVAYGANLEEAGAYPDNEEELVWLLNKAMPNVVSDGFSLRIEAPLGHLMKHEIVKMGLALDAPFDLTWSCYRGGEEHCGHCGPCFMRRKAFERNGCSDPVMP